MWIFLNYKKESSAAAFGSIFILQAWGIPSTYFCCVLNWRVVPSDGIKIDKLKIIYNGRVDKICTNVSFDFILWQIPPLSYFKNSRLLLMRNDGTARLVYCLILSLSNKYDTTLTHEIRAIITKCRLEFFDCFPQILRIFAVLIT